MSAYNVRLVRPLSSDHFLYHKMYMYRYILLYAETILSCHSRTLYTLIKRLIRAENLQKSAFVILLFTIFSFGGSISIIFWQILS